MIPADHFSDDGDGTAWVIVEADTPPIVDLRADTEEPIDRPCDTCDGCRHLCVDGVNNVPCPDCDGTGRHTFEVQMACRCANGSFCSMSRTFRVSVVPGMVLPIVAWGRRGESVPPHIITQLPRPSGVIVQADDDIGQAITLPPAAEPGMWAVKLRLSS